VAIEEEILFPLYEARAWRKARAPQVMRHEHRAIEAAIETMRDGLARQNVARFREGYARLHAVLPAHHLKEEHVLYAAIDAVLTHAEREAIGRRLAARTSTSFA
jgi:iron-sulfur cluster repair protein YtfE (RIC family)